jgi:glycosyltransferase involved in cell wall biosynthesis
VHPKVGQGAFRLATARPRAARGITLRILFLLSEAFRSHGGLQAYNRTLLRAAADFVLANGGSVQALCQKDSIRDFDARYLPAEAGTFQGFDGSRSAFATAAMLAARQRPDWVILGHAQYLPLAPLLRGLARRRVACVLLGVEAWARWRPLQRLGRGACTEFITISDFTHRQNQRVNHTQQTPAHLLPCSLDPFWEPPATQPGKPSGTTLLTVARLSSRERYKGVDDLIAALPLVQWAHPKVRLRVVGDGSDRSRLEALARELQLGDEVAFLGAIGDDDLRLEYAACDLFAMPSAREGFGIVFLEAASYRKASLGATAGGTPEVIRDGFTGILVPPGNPALLSLTIVDLLRSPERLAALGNAAFEDLQTRFSFSSFRTRFGEMLTAPRGSAEDSYDPTFR